MNNQWLSISIYCLQEEQHEILREGILPIAQDLVRRNLIKTWFFRSHDDGGSYNLATLFEVDQQQRAGVAAAISAHYQKYLAQRQPALRFSLFPEDSLYRPFPLHSVQHGVYPIPNVLQRQYAPLEQLLSEIMIEALAAEPIDQETLLSFYAYLSLANLRIASHHPAIREVMTTVINQQYEKLAFTEATRQQLEDFLEDLLPDINQQTDFHLTQPWFRRWAEICLQYLNFHPQGIVFHFLNQRLQAQPALYPLMIYLLYQGASNLQ